MIDRSYMSNELGLKVLETTEIDVDLIDSGTIQVRTRDVEVGLDELADSIKQTILINPITVYKKDDGRYELIAGQRRLLAIKEKLGRKKIRATIIEKPKDELTAKMLSFIENEERKKMVNKDIVNFCNVMYGEKKSITEIAKVLHIPRDLVKHSIDLPRVPNQVRKAVIDGELSLPSAIRATDAYLWEPSSSDASGGEVKESDNKAKRVLQLAKLMDTDATTKEFQKGIVEAGQEDPDATPEEILEKGKTRVQEMIRVPMYNKDKKRLKNYADENTEGNESTAAGQLILDGLDDAGF